MEDIDSAIRNKNLDVLRLLLVDASTEVIQYTFYEAITTNNVNIVEYCIQCGADINFVYTNSEPPLECALRYDYPEIIQCLINHGAIVEFIHLMGESISRRHIGILLIDKYLTNHPMDINKIFSYILKDALHIHYLGIIRYLIGRGADITLVNYKLLIFSVSYQQMDIVQHFFADGQVDVPSSQLQEALISAIAVSSTIMVDYLLTKGAQLNGKTYIPADYNYYTDSYGCIEKTPLEAAQDTGNPNMLTYFN